MFSVPPIASVTEYHYCAVLKNSTPNLAHDMACVLAECRNESKPRGFHSINIQFSKMEVSLESSFRIENIQFCSNSFLKMTRAVFAEAAKSKLLFQTSLRKRSTLHCTYCEPTELKVKIQEFCTSVRSTHRPHTLSHTVQQRPMHFSPNEVHSYDVKEKPRGKAETQAHWTNIEFAQPSQAIRKTIKP